MSQGFFQDEGKKDKKGKKLLGKIFTLHHCYEVLKNEEKWTNRGKVDVPSLMMMYQVVARIGREALLLTRLRTQEGQSLDGGKPKR
jgi:hypothetical protein